VIILIEKGASEGALFLMFAALFFAYFQANRGEFFR
jgi:hypothetical protein